MMRKWLRRRWKIYYEKHKNVVILQYIEQDSKSVVVDVAKVCCLYSEDSFNRLQNVIQ